MVLELQAPGGRVTQLDVELEQSGNSIPVFSVSGPEDPLLVRDSNQVRVTSRVGKQHSPELQEGAARLVVRASRPTLFGLQQAWTTVSRDITVKLIPPQVSVLSQFHYINHGGSEMAVYRVSPGSQLSGVRVGDVEYTGFPASGAGVAAADSLLRVAFFALRWNQDVRTPITVFARDDAGNEGSATFDFRVFPKVFRNSRIDLDDRFLARVVPAILQNTPELRVDNPADLIGSYVRINRDLRRMNDTRISELARGTSATLLWVGPFRQLSNTAVEAGFADRRTYIYKGSEVDRQTHLGFDLASTAAAAVVAANHGIVLFAGWLGIYGNCVILDHGMGLQSLYAHLSSIDVNAGDTVQMNHQLGRSGATGLAGGDHLHFTMLLSGNAVNPIDWWSGQWVEDRIMRKLREAR
jgi:murein DD-endopeptidase MepM/ murein hydrolase activator NlpD